jgi:hypothetical protein
MIPDILKKLRIFVASPSDVASERAKVETVAAALKPMADYLGLALEVSDWRKVVPEMGRPQQVIFDQLQPTSWDVFIGILWHRFGTPPAAIDPQRQTEYLSGTEEEFWTTYQLWQQFGRPRMMMYRCTRLSHPTCLTQTNTNSLENSSSSLKPKASIPVWHNRSTRLKRLKK